MTGRLREKDLYEALEFQRRVAAAPDLESFRPALIDAIRELIRCDVGAYNEINPTTGEMLWLTDPAPDVLAADPDAFMRNADSHPILARHQSGDPSALMLSDFLTRRRLRDTGIYSEFFGPLNINSQLAAMVEGPAPLVVAISVNSERREFSERDREMLDLVRPFIGHAFAAAVERAHNERLVRALEADAEHEGTAVLLLSCDGLIEAASRGAQRAVKEHFGAPAAPGRLPAPLADWVESRSRRALANGHGTADPGDVAELRRKDVALRLRFVPHRSPIDGDMLVIQERRAVPSPAQLRSLGLTRRETEVLSLIAAGHTNARIAESLTVSPHTVKRHAENIYAKLDVAGRTEAAARAHAVDWA